VSVGGVSRKGKFQIGGQCVVVFNGTNTQTVNVFSGPDESGEKQYVVRVRQPMLTSVGELESRAFSGVDELKAYLLEQHDGKIEEPKDRIYAQLLERLAGIADDLRDGAHVQPTTVREFLSWFEAKRRGPAVVDALRACLADSGLATDPDFEATFIDSAISFVCAPDEPETRTSAEKDGSRGGETLGELEALDPAYLVSRLKAFDGVAQFVSPTDPLEVATTTMLADDLAQLPVMIGRRDVKGVISWKGIGKRLALGRQRGTVNDFMDRHAEVEMTDALSTLIERVAEHDYVLVRDRSRGNVIVGSVSARDLNEQLHNLSRPFFLIGEIEKHIRFLVQPCIAPEDFADALDSDDSGTPVRPSGNLSLGECQRWLGKQDNWAKVGIALDRAEFVNRLEEVLAIRNDVMHFNSDAIDADLKVLGDFSRLLQSLHLMGPT
jgi:hypothetical protein